MHDPGPSSSAFWPVSGGNAAAADFVWRTKYRAAGEADIGATWRRVARAAAAREHDPGLWERRFLQVLEGFRFLPAGRILAGAGRPGGGALCNCFVMPPVAAGTAGIVSALRQAILTLKGGGGIGCDFSEIGAFGGPGPAELLPLWETACEVMLAHGPRRGAMMATLRCDHPGIEAFIAAKTNSGALRHFNLSVQIPDAFIAAVREDAPWPLRHGGGGALREVRARALWDRIMRAAYACGDPGVLFVDQINREDNLAWREHITACNPCGEIPLPPFGACVLGSLNLTAFVRGAFGPRARLDTSALAAAAAAVRFLDDVLDLARFPLRPQARLARAVRRIGLGITGLADTFLMLGFRYGDPASVSLAEATVGLLRDVAYETSAALAREKGAFPAFDRGHASEAPFVRRLPDRLRRLLARNGLRNSHLPAIAPAGSISLLAGGVSSGIEPLFAPRQTRTILDREGEPHSFILDSYALALAQALAGEPAKTAGMALAAPVEIDRHIAVQAALQPYVDNAISKTVNVAADCPYETFRQIFDLAYDNRLKGCTAFRDPGGGLDGRPPCAAR